MVYSVIMYDVTYGVITSRVPINKKNSALAMMKL